MNKKDLVAEISYRSQLTQKDVDKVLSVFVDIVGDTLAKRERVKIVGFGYFEVRERQARMSKNPRTGESVQIAASKTPVFKAGKLLKEKLNSEMRK